MQNITIIGLAASVCTGTSMLPQLIKIVREKAADDVSLVMLGVLTAGLVLWVWYGTRLHDYIIVGSNGFSALICLLIIIFTLRYKNSGHGKNKP